MTVIVAGSRGVTDYKVVVKAIKESGFYVFELVSGTAKGVDQLGERWAFKKGIPVIRKPANWSKYGKGAGFKRNIEMAEMADALIAIWDGESRGTMNMIGEAKKRGLKVYVEMI